MTRNSVPSTAQIASHPIHPMLVPFPIACFVGALADRHRLLRRLAEMMWADFSAWLLVVGVIMGVLAAIAGLIDFLEQPPDPRAGAGLAAHARQHRRAGARRSSTLLVHTRDAWTSVVPTGLILSRHHRADPARHRLARLGDGLSPWRRSGPMMIAIASSPAA